MYMYMVKMCHYGCFKKLNNWMGNEINKIKIYELRMGDPIIKRWMICMVSL